VTDDEKQTPENPTPEEPETEQPEATEPEAEQPVAEQPEAVEPEAEQPAAPTSPAASPSPTMDLAGILAPFKAFGEFIAKQPPIVLWGLAIIALFVFLLTLINTEVPVQLTDAQLLATAQTELDTLQSEADAAAAEVTPDFDATATVLFAAATESAEEAMAAAEGETEAEAAAAEEMAAQMGTLEANVQRQNVLGTSQALSLNRMDTNATASAEELANAQATLEGIDVMLTEQADAMATAAAAPTEAADDVDAELLAEQIDELRQEIQGYQAEATLRADQIANLYATATAEADAMSDVDAQIADLEATAAAQADVIATQEAQLEAIRDTLDALGNSGD
jgi:uncharacterized membrane-anchored protein YhcB (DUF1043 family)